MLEILFGFGRLEADTQRLNDAHQILTFVIRHDATGSDIKEQAEELLRTLGLADLHASSHSEMKDLDTVVQDILKQRPQSGTADV